VLQKVSFPSGSRISRSVEDATFICGHHILNVDEGVFSAVLLEEFESSLDEVTQVVDLALTVVDLVSNVLVLGLEEVEDGKDLSVVGYEGLTDGIGAEDEMLENLKGHLDNLVVAGVKSGLNWDDELGNNGEDLGSTLLEHIKDTLNGEESVGFALLADTFEENRKVMMVVELSNIDFPVDLVLRSVIDSDGEISSVVEASELTGGDVSGFNGTSFRGGDLGLVLWLGERSGLTSSSISLLKGGGSCSSNRSLLSVDASDGFNFDWSLDSGCVGEVTEGRVHVLGLKRIGVRVESLGSIRLAKELLEVVLGHHG